MSSQPNTAPASEGKPSEIKYRPLEDILSHEPLEFYCPGGYHPVEMDDELGESGRFKVMRKLG